MRSKKTKPIQISVLPTVENLMIGIAMKEFHGNLNAYVRDIIYKDLLQRRCMDQIAINLLKEQEQQ